MPLNPSLGYESSDEHWRVAIECKTCTDEECPASVFDGKYYGEPRRIGGSVTYRFR